MTKKRCPCGKPTPYSTCCLLNRRPCPPSASPALQRLQHAYHTLWQDQLVSFIQARSPAVIALAWADSLPTTWPRTLARAPLMRDFFNDWLAFTWVPYDNPGDSALSLGQSLAAQCHTMAGNPWPRAVVQCLEAMQDSYYSVYRVLASHDNGQLTVDDLFLHKTVAVQSALPLQGVHPETLLVSRFLRWEGEAYLFNSLSYHLPITATTFLHGWDDWSVTESSPQTVAQLQQEATHYALVRYALWLLTTLYTPKATAIKNEQDDPILPTQTQFTLTGSLADTLSRLLPLLLGQAIELPVTPTALTGVRDMVIPWYREDNTYVGRLSVAAKQLTLDTESQPLAKWGQTALQQCLGPQATFKQAIAQKGPRLLVKVEGDAA